MIRFHMKTALHKIVRALGVMFRKVRLVQRGETPSTDVAIDADFFAQAEAFRRTEAQHRNSYRELAN